MAESKRIDQNSDEETDTKSNYRHYRDIFLKGEEKKEKEEFKEKFPNKKILENLKNFKLTISVILIGIIFGILILAIYQVQKKINELQNENNELKAKLKDSIKKIEDQDGIIFNLNEKLKNYEVELKINLQHCHKSSIEDISDSDREKDEEEGFWSKLLFGESKKTIDHYLKSEDEFKNSIKLLLMNEFQNQFRETWTQIFSSIISSLDREEEPSRPSILMIFGHSTEFNECFSIEIAKAASINSNYKIITSDWLNKKESISEIQEKIKFYLENEGKVIIVRDLDKVEKEEILWVFHAFCDNTQAFDNRAIFIFTITLNENYQEINWSHWEGKKIAKSILEKSWINVTFENKAPIISRVAANVILLNKEKNCIS